MADTVPTLEAIISAVVSEIGTISNIGHVVNGFHTYEDDVEYIQKSGFLSGGTLDVWFVDLRSSREVEPIAGEKFEIYGIEVRYWSVRTDQAAWSQETRQAVASVKAVLDGDDAVFAIGGQQPLLGTPKTVKWERHGQTSLRAIDDSQMIYQGVILLEVEGRRWS
jgi:hypothetical protein